MLCIYNVCVCIVYSQCNTCIFIFWRISCHMKSEQISNFPEMMNKPDATWILDSAWSRKNEMCVVCEFCSVNVVQLSCPGKSGSSEHVPAGGAVSGHWSFMESPNNRALVERAHSSSFICNGSCLNACQQPATFSLSLTVNTWRGLRGLSMGIDSRTQRP